MRSVLLAAVLMLSSAASAAVAAPNIFYVQPLGDALPDADVALVVRALTDVYGLTVKVLPRIPLPPSAFYEPRHRWRADKLLTFLRPRLLPDGVRILGLTAADISTTKDAVYDWGVIGLGEEPGVAGVISSFRCRRRAHDPLQARQRLAKVAVHEIGHTLGLPHCPSKSCLMADAEGSVLSTDREYDLCARCRAQLAATGHALPLLTKLPWPAPSDH